MDLTTALRTVQRPFLLPGRSDAKLVESVRSKIAAPDHRDVLDVSGLDGGAVIRGEDVLLNLATATRPRYQDDVYDVHAQWALLRYIGVFAERDGSDERIGLSEAGQRIVGNQRRVMSEDLGIGFATLLSGGWLVPGGDAGEPTVTVVDVDVLLDDGGGYEFEVEQVGKRRPDYLLIGRDADSGVHLGLLECKGTKARSNAITQLASASEQLAGLLVDGGHPRGLAVSSMVGNRGIEYFAVQREFPSPADLMETPRPSIAFDDVRFPDRGSLRAVVDQRVTVAPADPVGRRVGLSRDGVAALAGPAIATSWATLAQLAGNEEAADRWSIASRRHPDGPRSRARQDHPGPRGTTIRGTAQTVTLPGGQLEMVLGVLDYVDDALSSGDPAAVWEAQRRAAADRRRSDSPEPGGDDDVVATHADSGAALLLRAI